MPDARIGRGTVACTADTLLIEQPRQVGVLLQENLSLRNDFFFQNTYNMMKFFALHVFPDIYVKKLCRVEASLSFI